MLVYIDMCIYFVKEKQIEQKCCLSVGCSTKEIADGVETNPAQVKHLSKQ